MRRKWPVVAAAIPLAFGWALLAAHPAAASTRAGLPCPGAQVQPGGPVGDMASDGSFAVNYTGTGYAQWLGF